MPLESALDPCACFRGVGTEGERVRSRWRAWFSMPSEGALIGRLDEHALPIDDGNAHPGRREDGAKEILR